MNIKPVLPLVLLLLSACNERGEMQADSAPRGVEVPDHFLEYLNDQQGQVLSTTWSQAYYRAVDPNNIRTTLEAWKAANEFDSCDEQVHVIFRDAKDLGYGRNMQGCKHDDGRVAVFVNNYVVRVQPGDPANYGPINVEAAIAEDPHHLQGTNAIEFTPIDPNDPGSDKVAKFFTFTPDGQLNLSADLDGRGAKPMPQPCLLCHGSTLPPWDSEAIISSATPWAEPDVEKTLKSTKMNLLEIERSEYSPYVAGYSRNDQEEALRQLNSFVLSTYEETANRATVDPGHWWPDFAIEIARKRYAGQPEVPGQTYQDDSLPCGWRVDPRLDVDCIGLPDLPADVRPEGVEVLYKRVVEPHCIACHSLRGSSAGQRQADPVGGNAISFSNYEKFIGYSDLIVDYVYHRGVMPLSLRNYEKFWADRCEGAPALLASFLPEFDRYDAQSCVITPGLPVALPGVDRSVRSPATLDASASLFASQYQWEVLSTPGPFTVSRFSDASAAAPVFYASHNGDYVLQLTVSNVRGSDSEQLLLTVDSAMTPSPAQLNFVDHVVPMLRDNTFPGRDRRCTECHSDSAQSQVAGLYRGIPVIYDQDDSVYQAVLQRIDLVEPENSILLRKPTRDQHGGGKIIDRESVDGEALYQMLYSFRRSGASCGNDPQICG